MRRSNDAYYIITSPCDKLSRARQDRVVCLVVCLEFAQFLCLDTFGYNRVSYLVTCTCDALFPLEEKR